MSPPCKFLDPNAKNENKMEFAAWTNIVTRPDSRVGDLEIPHDVEIRQR